MMHIHAALQPPLAHPAPVVRLFMETLFMETEPGVEERVVPVLSLRVDDASQEVRARRLLEGFGPVEIGCLDHVVAPLDSDAEYVVDVDEDVHALCSFTAHAVPRLRELGFEVEIAADYPYQIVEASGWYADVEDDGRRPDWFALELGVDVGGERVNLMPALLDLIEKTAGSGLKSLTRVPARLRALPVAPNRWVTLEPERLARILRVLYDLHTGARSKLDAVRFPAAASALLGEIDSALGDGDGRPLRWRGGAGVVERGRALAGEPSFCAKPVALRAVLRPYQHEGLSWIQHLRAHDAGGILADDMGLGKTLQTIAHLAIEKEARRMDLPSLIVVPTTLVGNWNRELARFAPHLRTCTWHGAARRRKLAELRRAEVIVTTYPVVCRDLDVLAELELHYVVLDEAQAIKNPRSQAAAAVKSLHARHRLCLTGTPIENNLEELWSLFDFLMPGLLGTAEAFRQRYRQRVEHEGEDTRLEALRERVAPYVLRRMKETVATELPPKTVLVRPVEIEGDQRDLYESIRLAAHGDVRQAIRDRGFSGSVLAVLDALMKLRQVCCDPRLVAVPAARDVKRSAKYDALMSLLERQLGQGRRILVFSQYTRMLALISEGLLARGVRHLTLTGETRDRQARVDAFEQGKAEVFLISLKAGGTGLNLTSADTVVHYDPWWNAAAQAQATDRAHRIGQTKPVFVHNLIVAGSVEERMLRLQERKKHLADVLLGTGGPPRPALSEQDVDDLFAPLGDPDTA